jgi:hypothetical protein
MTSTPRLAGKALDFNILIKNLDKVLFIGAPVAWLHSKRIACDSEKSLALPNSENTI